MTSLEDDIARIAALRGRTAGDYAQPQARPKPSPQSVQLLFRNTADSKLALRAFDTLPAASRAFIRESPHPINTLAWLDLLAHHDESDIITAARSLTTWPETRRRPRSRR